MARFWLIFFQPAEKLFSRKSAQRNECHSSLIVGMGIASYRGHKRNQLFPPQKLTGPSPSGWLFFVLFPVARKRSSWLSGEDGASGFHTRRALVRK